MTAVLTPEIKDQIKRIDIKIYLTETTGAVFSGTNCLCPHPDHNDKNPSFSVWTDRSGNYCWCCYGCHCGSKNLSGDHKNYGNDIIALVQWLSDYKGSSHVLTFQEAVEKVCRYADIELPARSGYGYENRKVVQNNQLAKAFNANLMKHKDFEAYRYLISRGLDAQDISAWLLGYDGERITFPLINRNHNVIGFSNRVVGSSSGAAKYINSPNSELFQKSEYLYGIHRFDFGLDYCFITEGQLDVIGATKYGLKNVLAPLGKALTEKHMLILEKFTNLKNIVILFDADEAGQEALPKAAELVRRHGFSASYVSLPQGMDLFDYSMQQKENLVNAIYSRTNYYFYKQLEPYVQELDLMLFSLQSRVMQVSQRIDDSILVQDEKKLLHSYLRSKFNVFLGGKTDVVLAKEYTDKTKAV